MFRSAVLAVICVVTMAGVASAASTNPETLAATTQIAAAHASESEDMLRASKFIGKTVRNGRGETIGSVDDLILNRGERVLYAVISVGGFLGIGNKLVAVPFEDLTIGAKDVEGVVVYDRTKEQLKAQPAFVYADAAEGMSRERFMQSAQRRVEIWQDRIDKSMKDAKGNAAKLKEGASERVDSAWTKVKAEWAKVKSASAEAWQSAKRKFDDAMTDLERAWNDATS